MPNWACGNVSVKGTKQGVLDFTGRFIYTINKGVAMYTIGGFFSRSFVNEPRQGIVDEIENIFADKEPDAVAEYSLPVDFAWSAGGCLFKDSSQKDAECINLDDACIADQVSVEIQAEEPGMGFEENITCDEYGGVCSESMDLKSYKCPKCGAIQSCASFNDPDDLYCDECDEVGFVPITEDDNDG